MARLSTVVNIIEGHLVGPGRWRLLARRSDVLLNARIRGEPGRSVLDSGADEAPNTCDGLRPTAEPSPFCARHDAVEHDEHLGRSPARLELPRHLLDNNRSERLSDDRERLVADVGQQRFDVQSREIGHLPKRTLTPVQAGRLEAEHPPPALERYTNG